MNHLIVIGYLGASLAYLNVPMEEARRRYEEEEGPITGEPITEFEFEDEFSVYAAYPK